MTIRNLQSLFQPASIAVIGASDRAGSLGRVVLRNLKSSGFAGPVWPVNSKRDLVDGGPAWADVPALPGVPELAVICTPADTVPGLIAQLGALGTRAAIVMTAGLKAPAQEGGPTLEQAMLDAARPHLLRILGPNCLGALVPGVGLNASFAPGKALPGNLAFVTQSGALATAMLDWANGRGIGFSHFVSLGDGADVDFGDMLDYLGSDPGTRAVLMYMESVTSARKFMSAARGAARNKPVIVVKSGRAPEGAKAAASHTGALAGSDAVFDAAVRRAGMLRVDTLEDLFVAAETLAHGHAWRGERLAVLTNGGGAGVLAADALSLGGGKLAVLDKATLDALDACLPATWSHGNPVDIIGDAPVARYGDALRILLEAPEVDGVLFMHAPTAIVPAVDIALACLPFVSKPAKPVLACWLGGPSVQQAREVFSAAGVACHRTPESAAGAWLQLARYAAHQAVLRELPRTAQTDFVPNRQDAMEVMEAAAANGQEWLDAVQAQRVLQAYGLPVQPVQMAWNADQAVTLAQRIGYPVALKIVSPQIIHKSDVGGVAISLRSGDEVHAAAVRMRVDAARLAPRAPVLGFTVQGMASRKGATELILGLATDAVFGPVMLFGEGGVGVELSRRHAVGLPPLNAELARDLVSQTGLARRLAGYRGSKPVNMAAVEDAMLKVSQMACDLPLLAELDINPLLADADGVLALDARIRLRPAGSPAVRTAIRPYPEGLEEALQLQGTSLLVRPIRTDDGARLMDFYGRATPGDLHMRFFMARREVPQSEVARYCQIDYDREMAFIALAPAAGGAQEMVGEIRAVADPDNLRAEFAIQVATAWQGKGLGTALMRRMAAYLRTRGTIEMVGECMTENEGMTRLARAAGFTVSAGAALNDGALGLGLLLNAAGSPAA
ncbi:MAG: bifunctional acetate--CoA ligase family protein/GNAT family N-acetyltransferase [Pseudomonadota bacterium]